VNAILTWPHWRSIFAVIVVLLNAACSPVPSEDEKRAILTAYRQQAYAVYDDAYMAAKELYAAASDLQKSPSQTSLDKARQAWRQARVPYSQSEALRFGNWFVDDWEKGVNSWPLDEGFIDYVNENYQASASNNWARANLMGAQHIIVAGRSVPLNYIVNKQLQMLESASGIESNIATGYHALEFMLWGQDKHGYASGAGERPWTDFSQDPSLCSNGEHLATTIAPCRKRGEFLQAQSMHVLSQLRDMRGYWAPGNGNAGARLQQADVNEGLSRILFGLLAMSAEELAGERMQVALMSNSPEEEQDCFSDDTHHSLWYNALGIENFYYGRYDGRNSIQLQSTSLAALASKYYPELARDIDAGFSETKAAMRAILDAGNSGEQYIDQLIAPGNDAGHQLLTRAIMALQAQAGLLKKLGNELGLSLTSPASVAQVAL
jgi:putative iron-regulated protein